MIYEKRLLVLGGSASSGCLRLERTSAGVSCALSGNVKGGCVLVIRDDVNFFSFGDIALSGTYRFNLPASVNFDSLVAAVGDLSGKLIMCGGFKRPMPWRSNIEDDINRALRCLGIKREHAAPKPRDIEQFFFDIVPTDYDDTRVAEVNYYRSNLTEDVQEPLGQYAQEQAEELPETGTRESESREYKIQEPPAPHKEPIKEPVKPAPAKTREPEPTEPAPSAPTPDEVASTITEPPLKSDNYETKKRPAELPPVSFYESIKDQIERLFAKNERYGRLEQLLPESRWIKVNYDSHGKYYLVGTIGDPVRYLCYGVPGEYSPTPPPDLVGYCQWLAADENDPAGKGFWIMYQDGVTGKSVL